MSQLSELKKILLGEHAEEVKVLKQRVEEAPNRIKDISDVLPQAIEESLESQPEEFSRAMERTIPDSVKKAITRDPEGFATIFFPVLAPSIRMMIANAIRGFASSMNHAVESTATLKGLKWRFESIKTGIPYSEIAVRRSLKYRVEQLFLIDKDTGLLIENIINENVQGLDSDAVSAMLTAIQSFVRESFNTSDNEDLTDMVVGDHNVWMVHGPEALIACVIRGDAPVELRGQLIDVLDRIHIRHSQALVDYDGSEKLNGVIDELEPCLQLKLKEYDGERKKKSLSSIILMALVCLGLILWLVWSYERNRIRNIVSKHLSTTQGILPTDVFWEKGKLNVVGLMDPLAEVPWAKLEDQGVEREEIEFIIKQYSSLEPQIFTRRLRQELAIPEGIDIDINEAFNKKFALLKGQSDFETISQLKLRLANNLRADLSFDTTNLRVNSDGLTTFVEQKIGLPNSISLSLTNNEVEVIGIPDAEWYLSLVDLVGDRYGYVLKAPELQKDLFNQIKSTQLVFVEFSSLEDGEYNKFDLLAQNIKSLSQIVSQTGDHLIVKVKGYSDGDSTQQYNQVARVQRVNYVIEQLMTRGVKIQSITHRPNTNLYGDNQRSVKFFPIIKKNKKH